jgi:hypothetical protein
MILVNRTWAGLTDGQDASLPAGRAEFGYGAAMGRRHLKIVRLLEPELCLDCRFAKTADVESESGVHQRMIYCRRLDCDNWDIVDAEPAKSMVVDDSLDEAA